MSIALLAMAGCSDPDPMVAQKKYEAYERSTLFADGRAMRPLPPHVIAREMPLTNDPRTTGRDERGYLRTIPLPIDAALLEKGRHGFEIYCATCHGLLGDGDSSVAKKMPLRPPPSLVVHTPHQLLRPEQLPPWLSANLVPDAGTPLGRIQAFLPIPAVEGTSLSAAPRTAPGEKDPSEMPEEELQRLAATAGGLHPHFWPGHVFRVITDGYGLMPSYVNELDPDERWAVVAYLDALRLSQRAVVAQLPAETRRKLEREAR